MTYRCRSPTARGSASSAPTAPARPPRSAVSSAACVRAAAGGAFVVLRRVSLWRGAGGRLGVFGHNGAGKTTLLRCIVGAVRPRDGKVDIDGADTGVATIAENVRRGIAFVPQGHNVFPNLSIKQNLGIAGLLFDPAFVAQVYELFPVLAERRQQRAGSMSGGEQQMLALGMALMTSRNGCCSTSLRPALHP